MIVVLSGKSGAGKNAVMEKMIEEARGDILPLISATTRPMREGEINGKDYFFVSEEEFRKKEAEGQIIEKREYQSADGSVWHYGTMEFINAKGDYVKILDREGAEKFRERYGDECFLVYLDVDDKTRRERAERRGSFDADEWEKREKREKEEFRDIPFNYRAENYDLETAVYDIMDALETYKEAVRRKEIHRKENGVCDESRIIVYEETESGTGAVIFKYTTEKGIEAEEKFIDENFGR